MLTAYTIIARHPLAMSLPKTYIFKDKGSELYRLDPDAVLQKLNSATGH